MTTLRRLASRRLLASCCILLVLAGTAGTIGLMTSSPASATGNLEVITSGGTAIGNRVWPSTMNPIPWNFFDPNGAAPSCNYNSPAPNGAPVATLLPNVTASATAWNNLTHSSVEFS